MYIFLKQKSYFQYSYCKVSVFFEKSEKKQITFSNRAPVSVQTAKSALCDILIRKRYPDKKRAKSYFEVLEKN
jgi:hypothetical protein